MDDRGATVAVWLYFTLFEVLRGATPGKARQRLIVSGPGGGRISFARSSARFGAALLGVLMLGIGLLMIPFSKGHRGLHDTMTHTDVVVRPRRS